MAFEPAPSCLPKKLPFRLWYLAYTARRNIVEKAAGNHSCVLLQRTERRILTCHHEVKTSHCGGGILRFFPFFPFAPEGRLRVVGAIAMSVPFPSAEFDIIPVSTAWAVFSLRTTVGSLPRSESKDIRIY